MPLADDIATRVSAVPFWRHRIPLPGGLITPGSQDTLAQLPTIGLPPDLTGWSVLDIGCSDGFYSFECEKRGASRVVAVDNFSSVYIDAPSGFQVAREVLGSRVEFIEADLFALDAATAGSFDLVLFLGVLYHLRHPLLGLERVAALCRKQVIVETEIAPSAINPGTPFGGLIARVVSLPRQWMTFFPADDGLAPEINHDPTTFWAPSVGCGEAMLRSCGFCDVTTFSQTATRAVFHGFSPEHGDDVARTIEVYGRENLAGAAGEVLGRPVEQASIATELPRVSIVQFGRIKQVAAERRAKAWHRGDRWRTPH